MIDGVVKNLREYYVYADIAEKMADAIRANEQNGEYSAIADPDAFALRLTNDLQAVSHDRHLRVRYSPGKLLPEGQRPSSEQEAELKKMLERTNCGFEKVDVLSHNIGYLKFDVFADPRVCGPTLVAAMNFLAHVDAIIFDLRANGGGDPKMVAMVASYLFDNPTHLNDLYNRQENSTTQYWTLRYVPGTRLAHQPAYVLTSKRTFSGAEEFAYDLQTLKRATIVGETTGGGAHPVHGLRIDDHFIIGVPFARAVNPITKTNWEATGVEPNIPTRADDALERAEQLAMRQLSEKE